MQQLGGTQDLTMSPSRSQRSLFGPPGRVIVLAIAALLGVLTAVAAALWVHYGTAVFVHTIMAGIAACM